MVSSLQQSPLFFGLNPDEIENLFNNKAVKTKYFDKEIQIAAKGDKVREMVLILLGSVRGEMTDYNGKTIKIVV